MSDILVENIYLSMMCPNDTVLLNAPENVSWAIHGNVVQGIPQGEAAQITGEMR